MAASPISPARFAAALQDLPLSSLALKVAELRNSIAHLDYSNEQLAPFARDGADRVCVEAIEENEGVIASMNERIALVKVEVERRGASWRELGFVLPRDAADADADAEADVAVGGEAEGKLNGLGAEGHVAVLNGGGAHGEAQSGTGGVGAAVGRHSAWTDGTFQTGTIGGGAVTANASAGQGRGQRRQGGTLGDEELRRRLEERMAIDEADEDGGMHL